MSNTSVSSLFGALRTSGIFSSKTAVLAVLVVGVEEYYFAGIYKMIQKIVEKSGNEYEYSRKERLDFVWIFDDSGLYAAEVHKSDWFLSIIIYDCMEKKSYNYLEQFTELKPDYFYWFNDDLILIHIDQNNCIQQIQMKLDHENRKAEKIQTRTRDFPYVINENGWSHKCYMKNSRKPLVESVETAILDEKEYILMMSLSGVTAVMIPKDPNCTLPTRNSIYVHPISDKIRVTGVDYQILDQMAHQQFLYLPKMSELAWWNKHEQKYILDGFIEINLLEQKNVQGQFVNTSAIREGDDQSGKEVLFSHVGTVPVNISLPRKVISAKRNGKVLAVVEDDITNRRYSCLIDVKLKQITWRKWEPKIQRKSNMILASLHPSGYFIEIDYKKKQEDDKFELFSKIVAHPNELIKLKTMSLVNLFSTESPLEPKFVNSMRRLL